MIQSVGDRDFSEHRICQSIQSFIVCVPLQWPSSSIFARCPYGPLQQRGRQKVSMAFICEGRVARQFLLGTSRDRSLGKNNHFGTINNQLWNTICTYDCICDMSYVSISLYLSLSLPLSLSLFSLYVYYIVV